MDLRIFISKYALESLKISKKNSTCSRSNVSIHNGKVIPNGIPLHDTI